MYGYDDKDKGSKGRERDLRRDGDFDDKTFREEDRVGSSSQPRNATSTPDVNTVLNTLDTPPVPEGMDKKKKEGDKVPPRTSNRMYTNSAYEYD